LPSQHCAISQLHMPIDKLASKLSAIGNSRISYAFHC
jgi:hypothetical protein